MKRFVMAVVVALAVGGLRAETLVGEWDFTKGGIDSVDGRFKAAARGVTRISGDGETGRFLSIGMSNGDKPEGIVMKEKYPQLSPGEGFRIEARVRLRERTSAQDMLVIWDSKYVYYKHAKPRPEYNQGMAFYLYRMKDGSFVPYVSLGCGDKGSENLAGEPMALKENQACTLSVAYDGAGQVVFKQDDQVNAVRRGSLGVPIAPAGYCTVIGDRVNSTFNHFDGDILGVKLFSLPLAK